MADAARRSSRSRSKADQAASRARRGRFILRRAAICSSSFAMALESATAASACCSRSCSSSSPASICSRPRASSPCSEDARSAAQDPRWRLGESQALRCVDEGKADWLVACIHCLHRESVSANAVWGGVGNASHSSRGVKFKSCVRGAGSIDCVCFNSSLTTRTCSRVPFTYPVRCSSLLIPSGTPMESRNCNHAVSIVVTATALLACRTTPPPDPRAELLHRLHDCLKSLPTGRPQGGFQSSCNAVEVSSLGGITRTDLVAGIGPPNYCVGKESGGNNYGTGDCPPQYNPWWSFYRLDPKVMVGGGLELECVADTSGHCTTVHWVISQ